MVPTLLSPVSRDDAAEAYRMCMKRILKPVTDYRTLLASTYIFGMLVPGCVIE